MLREVCTTPVVTVTAEAPIGEGRPSHEHGVRRLPVIDGQGRLTGIIALDDILMLLGTEMGHVASALSRELGRDAAVAVR